MHEVNASNVHSISNELTFLSTSHCNPGQPVLTVLCTERGGACYRADHRFAKYLHPRQTAITTLTLHYQHSCLLAARTLQPGSGGCLLSPHLPAYHRLEVAAQHKKAATHTASLCSQALPCLGSTLEHPDMIYWSACLPA